MEKTTESRLSRRSFLAMSGIAGLGALAGLSACSPASKGADDAADQAQISWSEEYDAVVVGAGGAGLSAAIELAEQGLSVALVDAGNSTSSSSSICGGYITMCETEMVPDSRDILYEDLVNSAQGDCQLDLARAYADNSPDLYRRLKEYGVEFLDAMGMAYMSKPWAHYIGGGGKATSKMTEKCKELGVTFIEDSRVIDIVEDGESGRIVGVNAGTPEKPLYIKGARGVILATGDFTHNPVLVKAFGTRGSDKMIPISGPNNKGDGFLMGLRHGAAPSYVTAGVNPALPLGVKTNKSLLQFMSNGAICLNMQGKRFYDESDNYVLVTKAALESNDVFFQLYDAPMRKMLEGNPTPDFAIPVEPEYTGSTLEELGKAVKADYPGFDVDAMVAQVAAYNGYVESGDDEEFGRTHITGESGELSKIETGPFYMLACNIGTDHFCGGLAIDAGTRVLDMEENPIPGLYAAGTLAGGLNGWGYMSGTCFGGAMIFGNLAAKTLIADTQ